MTDPSTLLDEARQALGLSSDRALAKALGVSQATVSRWATGSMAMAPLAVTLLRLLVEVPAARKWLLRRG